MSLMDSIRLEEKLRWTEHNLRLMRNERDHYRGICDSMALHPIKAEWGDLEDVNAMLEDALEENRELLDCVQESEDQFVQATVKNIELTNELDRCQEHIDELKRRLKFATLQYGSMILSRKYKEAR